jgi:hypothetical protein
VITVAYAAAQTQTEHRRLVVNDDPYREFEEALTDKLTETEYSLARVSRLAKARAAVDQFDPRYIDAVNRAFSVFNAPRQMR